MRVTVEGLLAVEGAEDGDVKAVARSRDGLESRDTEVSGADGGGA